MRFRLFRQQKAFTLTETIIYIGILSIVVVGIVSIIIQLISIKTKADSMNLITGEATNVLERLSVEIRGCSSFSVTSATTLSVVIDGTTKEFRLENGRLNVYEQSSSNALSSNLVNITNFSFTDWTSPNSDNLLHIQFQIERGGIHEYFQTSIHKR